MTIYRFKISFEDYEISRELDIRSIQTFADLHKAFHNSLNFSPEVPSSFYISNDQWIKGKEITIYPNEKRIEKKIALMEDSRLNNFIEDPHQKFYYISNFDRPFDIHVELIKILTLNENAETYPKLIKSLGESPKQFVQIVKPIEKGTPIEKPKKSGSVPTPNIPVAKTPVKIEEEPEDMDEVDEIEEEEPENDYTIESLEIEDHQELSLKMANEDGEEIDIPLEHDEIQGMEEDEFDEFGMREHEEDDHHKDDDY